MNSTNFFVPWALWEQMTFVLALGILLVFLAGLVKLWWTSRILKHQEALDSEKQTRLAEMHHSGIHVNKITAEIPFGVRALQSGIEVEGIWIFRPISRYDADRLQSTTSSMNRVDTKPQDKEKSNVARTELNESIDVISKPSVSTQDSLAQHISTLESDENGTKSAQLGYLHTYKPRQGNEVSGNFDDGSFQPQPYRMKRAKVVHLETYMPLSGAVEHLRAPKAARLQSNGQHSVAASQEAIPHSTVRLPFQDNAFSSVRPVAHTATGHELPIPSGAGPRVDTNDPIIRPSSSTTNNILLPSQQASRISQEEQQRGRTYNYDRSQERPKAVSINLNMEPQQHHFAGEAHANRVVRKVNAGFEILPAGTFGVPPEPSNNSEDTLELESGLQRRSNYYPPQVQIPNKLQKKNRSRSSSRESKNG